MPIYDYSCEACGHTFDVLQKLGAEALLDCPACGQPQLKKLMSAPAFHLKGKGWRNSDDTPKKPDTRPKFTHTFDSPVPHAEHDDSPASAKSGHSHGDHGHSHAGHKHAKAAEKKHSHSHDHGHSHGHSHGGGHKHEH